MGGRVPGSNASDSTEIYQEGLRIPPIKLYSYVIISRILLAVFLLVDLGSLRFEAVLFATLVAAFQLIESFVEDLSDPFGGAWSVASAREEVDELLKSLPRD